MNYNYDNVPKQKRRNLAATAYRAFSEDMKKPETRAILDAAKERLKRESEGATA